jgi:hypothetical protein
MNIVSAYLNSAGGYSANVLSGEELQPVDFDKDGKPEWAYIGLDNFSELSEKEMSDIKSGKYSEAFKEEKLLRQRMLGFVTKDMMDEAQGWVGSGR